MKDVEDALEAVHANQAKQIEELAALMDNSYLLKRVLSGEGKELRHGGEISTGDPAELLCPPSSVALAKPGPLAAVLGWSTAHLCSP